MEQNITKQFSPLVIEKFNDDVFNGGFSKVYPPKNFSVVYLMTAVNKKCTIANNCGEGRNCNKCSPER